MKRLTYTTKLFTYFSIIILLLGSAIILFQRRSETRYKREMINMQMQDYADGIYRYLSTSNDRDLASAAHILPDYMRVTVMLKDGTVLYDNSIPDGQAIENHLKRPEVHKANIDGEGFSSRKSKTLNKDFFYYCKLYHNDRFVRLAMPYERDLRLMTPDNVFLYFMVGMFIIAFVILVIFERRFHRSILSLQQFITSANQKQGDYERITFPNTDLGEIGREVIETYKMLDVSTKRFKTEREKLIQHFSFSNEGIAFFSKERKFIYANSHFIQILNAITDEPTFILDERILNAEDLKPIDDFLKQGKERKENFIKYKINKNGSHYGIRAQIFPDNSFEIILSNITGLEEERRLKHEMTSNIAHELRTPVSSIRGYIETMLQQPDLAPDKKEYFLQRSYSQLLRLSDLISDVSLINKMEEFGQHYPKTALNISGIFDEVKKDLEQILQEHNITIDNHIPSDVSIQGNESLVYAIFRNLVENSIRYAGDGVNIEMYKYSEDDKYYFFSFSDNGVGVSAESLNKLFDRFYRVDEGRGRAQGGSGLGLAIVKNAVIMHGGEISAKQKSGGGLEVIFSLAKH
ncbi:sensor histidine kinase [Porphyromonas pogonae]|uniref:sensor histidine kinase n=1 Tax=Porphyromonas pogonae TaxID=867595 RepID=UPI002E76F2DC|nr:ATP-binding protein [Porphyromonas pogonae]